MRSSADCAERFAGPTSLRLFKQIYRRPVASGRKSSQMGQMRQGRYENVQCLSRIPSGGVCCTITRIAHILDWGREHRPVQTTQQLLAPFSLTSDSGACIIVTTELPEPRPRSPKLYVQTSPSACGMGTFIRNYHRGAPERRRIGDSARVSHRKRTQCNLRQFWTRIGF